MLYIFLFTNHSFLETLSIFRRFPQFFGNRISGSPSKKKHQKNTLSHFTKTKHFYKTRKTQILRKYRKYQNKIDNYYGFLQYKIEIK